MRPNNGWHRVAARDASERQRELAFFLTRWWGSENRIGGTNCILNISSYERVAVGLPWRPIGLGLPNVALWSQH